MRYYTAQKQQICPWLHHKHTPKPPQPTQMHRTCALAKSSLDYAHAAEEAPRLVEARVCWFQLKLRYLRSFQTEMVNDLVLLRREARMRAMIVTPSSSRPSEISESPAEISVALANCGAVS